MPYKMRIEASFGTQSKLRRMDNEGERKEIESTTSFSGELSGEEGDASSDIVSSSDPEEMREDATSLRPFLGSPSSDHLQIGGGDPLEMSSLMSNLPLKRGLSRHYDGKSQSFRSLSNVMCLEDLVKPERPCKKQRLSSSAGWLQDIQNPLYLRTSSKSIKKVSRGSLCSPKTQK